jgi:predicted HTH transcriptional regulator
VAPATIEDLILEGESDELEFKSTLRWDLKEGTVSKKLEEVIAKTVAALANGNGGTLIIGVDDDGVIVGLGHDYQSLGGADRDKFELHVRNVLNEAFGIAFVTKVQVRFHELHGEDVCQIDVEPAREPVVLVTKDKNGQKVEKIYVRSGNASQELPLSEVNDYIRDRFR